MFLYNIIESYEVFSYVCDVWVMQPLADSYSENPKELPVSYRLNMSEINTTTWILLSRPLP